MGPPLAEAEHQRADASVPGVGVGAQENAARREGRPGETEEDGVSEFDDLEKKAEAYAEEYPEHADKGINEVAGFAERDTDHQHDEQIDRAAEATGAAHLPAPGPTGQPGLAGSLLIAGT
jgi:hypothetical protein